MHASILVTGLTAAFISASSASLMVRDDENRTSSIVPNTNTTATEEASTVSVVTTVIVSTVQASEIPSSPEPTDFSVQATNPEDGSSTASTSEKEGHIGIFVAHVENSAESLDMPTASVAVGVTEAHTNAAPSTQLPNNQAGAAVNAAGPLLVLPTNINAIAHQPTPQEESLVATTGTPLQGVDGQPGMPARLATGFLTVPGSATVLLVSGTPFTLAATPTQGAAPAPTLTIGGQTFTPLYSSKGPVYAINGEPLTPGATATATIGGKTYAVSLSSDSSSISVVELDSNRRPVATSTQMLSGSSSVSTTSSMPVTTTSSAAAETTSKVGGACTFDRLSSLAWGLGLLQGYLMLL